MSITQAYLTRLLRDLETACPAYDNPLWEETGSADNARRTWRAREFDGRVKLVAFWHTGNEAGAPVEIRIHLNGPNG
jgi:hypothetical protein